MYFLMSNANQVVLTNHVFRPNIWSLGPQCRFDDTRMKSSVSVRRCEETQLVNEDMT